ncbi:MAG: alpha/beta fold hydrolase [Pseudomonadota bacterium]
MAHGGIGVLIMNEVSEQKTVISQDRMFRAWLGRMTFGLSPPALMLAYLDWLVHLAVSPGKQAELWRKAVRKALRLGIYSLKCATNTGTSPCIEPLSYDRRFVTEPWQGWPYNLIYQSFLSTQQWWHNASTDVHGVSRHHQDAVSFAARQILDVFSPSNFLLTNPEIMQKTLAQGGMNLARGWQNFIEDWERAFGGKRPVGVERYQVGVNVAVTPGKVVFRNELIELIQYAPVTEKVHREPVLIVPAWIMKYYILDLSPHNSMVKYLVERGHTVFMISWKNPDAQDRHLGMEDYRSLGIMAAINVISTIQAQHRIHAVGYCLGGTLLMIAAAAMAHEDDDRFASITLLAAQTDFSEAGELMLFIDESQLTFLEDMMWEQGYLDAKQMSGAFQLLRSNDLIWSTMVHDYLLGKRQPMTDLMAWNTDTTRMPYRMHSEYLKRLFLNNDLAEGRCRVNGSPVTISDIRVPIFAVATTKDHVAPWQSVYKINLLADTEVTFLLTSGGHNAGIVSEPGHPRRSFQIVTRQEGDRFVDPKTWQATVPTRQGSWWPVWATWLEEISGDGESLPAMGAPEHGYPPLQDAPGSYVMLGNNDES